MRDCRYYIVDQSAERFQNSPGQPYGVGIVTARYTDGSPYHFYLGHYYASREEAWLVGRLAEYSARRLDHVAEECVLQGNWVYNLQARTAYRLLFDVPEIADPVSCLEHFGNTSHLDLPYQPSIEELNAFLNGRGDWRATWRNKLPPDPLQLLCFTPQASGFTEIDWLATIRRVAATVATRHHDGTLWSHIHAISLLFERCGFSPHWYLLQAAMRRLVHESRGTLEFGQWDERVDRTMFRWKGEDPAGYAASVPPCPYCGKLRDLTAKCKEVTYGTWESHRFMGCPFDGYGCQSGEVQWFCCSCSSIGMLITQGAPIAEIEEAIAARLQLLHERGGTPFLSARKEKNGEKAAHTSLQGKVFHEQK